MRDLPFDKTANVSQLDSQIRAVIGDKLDGIRDAPGGCVIVVQDAATPDDVKIIADLVAAHVPDPALDRRAVLLTGPVAPPIGGVTLESLAQEVTDLRDRLDKARIP